MRADILKLSVVAAPYGAFGSPSMSLSKYSCAFGRSSFSRPGSTTKIAERARPASEQPPHHPIADRAPAVQRSGPWATSDRQWLSRRLRELPHDAILRLPRRSGSAPFVWQRSGRPSTSPSQAAPHGPVRPSARVPTLQRSAGNRAVGVLARMPLKDHTADLITDRHLQGVRGFDR